MLCADFPLLVVAVAKRSLAHVHAPVPFFVRSIFSCNTSLQGTLFIPSPTTDPNHFITGNTIQSQSYNRPYRSEQTSPSWSWQWQKAWPTFMHLCRSSYVFSWNTPLQVTPFIPRPTTDPNALCRLSPLGRSSGKKPGPCSCTLAVLCTFTRNTL